MALVFSDTDIMAMLSEPKLIPEARAPTWKTKSGHKERDVAMRGESGRDYEVRLRQSLVNPLDFSIIVSTVVERTGQVFRLRRFNGKSHQHANKLEGTAPFYDFHIHTATERYQSSGHREDHFAEVTTAYGNIRGALAHALGVCSITVQPGFFSFV